MFGPVPGIGAALINSGDAVVKADPGTRMAQVNPVAGAVATGDPTLTPPLAYGATGSANGSAEDDPLRRERRGRQGKEQHPFAPAEEEEKTEHQVDVEV